MPDTHKRKHPGAGYVCLVAIVKRTVQASPEQIFAVLADGWTYSDWVVGTVHIRDVDEHWPQVGAQLHHKAGPWPLSLHDSSTVLAVVPNRSLKLRAGLWPLGSAVVEIILDPLTAGGTRITMKEDFEAGPLLFVRNKLNDLVLHRRNIESLRRLTDIVLRSTPKEVRR
ncbi:SRPBCC family protein [Amorphoplanes nipponensis]|uniref:Polyketide cyclase n=1 Tax=Actinoplanes nipponensis TaxID=135950 RepID=A0A919MKZ5_9ACTN|nr:polyketide cyclase [Actinoplanes nipponensis]